MKHQETYGRCGAGGTNGGGGRAGGKGRAGRAREEERRDGHGRGGVAVGGCGWLWVAVGGRLCVSQWKIEESCKDAY